MKPKLIFLTLIALFGPLVAQQEAMANGWVEIGNYSAEGIGFDEATAQADAESVMAEMVAAIASLYPAGTVVAIPTSTNWDQPFYTIEFTVYLKLF